MKLSRKNEINQKYQNFIRGVPYKLSQIPLNQIFFSNVDLNFGGLEVISNKKIGTLTPPNPKILRGGDNVRCAPPPPLSVFRYAQTGVNRVNLCHFSQLFYTK